MKPRELSLEGLSVLTIGTAMPTLIASWWLSESGAAVETTTLIADESPIAKQTQGQVNQADVQNKKVYDVVIADSASIDSAEIYGDPLIIEITSPFPISQDVDEALVFDMQLYARSGLGYLTREIGKDWELDGPCLPINRQASILAGIAAATAAAAGSIQTGPEGKNKRITIDQLELLALMPMQPIAYAQLNKRVVGSQRTVPSIPGGTMPTSNGFAYVRPVEPEHWAKLLQLVGQLESIASDVATAPGLLREHRELIDQRLRSWALAHTSEEVADTCQAEHIPVAPVYRPEEVVKDTHLNARNFFRDQDDLGVNLPWLSECRKSSESFSRNNNSFIRPSSSLPLAGLRVLDLSWAWAGPFATTLFADLGAEVINVEWHPRASNIRRNPPFANDDSDSHNTSGWWSANQRGKFSIGVNLKSENGKRIVHELAAISDVVVENFAPGVVDRLGVGYEDLVAFNPRIVYVSLSAFGQTGPRSHYIGYGTQVYAAAGAGFATSQDGTNMSQMFIPVPDPISGLVGAYAMASYVRNSRLTGKSARVDVSELEAMATVCLEPLLDALYQTTTVVEKYLVLGSSDSKYVLVVNPDIEGIAREFNVRAEMSILKSRLSGWSAVDILEKLSGMGSICCLIQDSNDVLSDPYLEKNKFWEKDYSKEVESTDILIGGSLWKVDNARTSVWRGAPQLFSDTKNILANLLGYSESDISRMIDEEAVVSA